jgi:hypothetical protein
MKKHHERLFVALYCQFESAFGTASLDNVAAITASHFSQESVDATSASTLGLICTLHEM